MPQHVATRACGVNAQMSLALRGGVHDREAECAGLRHEGREGHHGADARRRRISLCVYRPDAEGRFPALFAASPYQYEMDDVPAYPLFLWRETGPVEWYVGQGYAYVHADVRGSGQSEGEFEFMGPNEQQDYLELIAWIVAAAVVQRPGRRHRPVLLRHGAVADGDLQPAGPRLHRAV